MKLSPTQEDVLRTTLDASLAEQNEFFEPLYGCVYERTRKGLVKKGAVVKVRGRWRIAPEVAEQLRSQA